MTLRHLRKDESGQAIVLMTVALAAVMGMCALVLDVGAWYRQHRHQQAVADASALAGAQALPENPSSAVSLANSYASANNGSLATVGVSQLVRPNDKITVTTNTSHPGFFSGVLGINAVSVKTRAAAIAGPPAAAAYVSPITVDDNPQVLCGPSCFGASVYLGFNHSGSYPGIWTEAGVSNLDGSGTPSSSAVAGWLTNTYAGPVTLKSYPGFAPAMFNSPEVQAALKALIGKSIIVFVHSSGGPKGTGPYAEIGWASFVIQSVGVRPDGISGFMTGYFSTATVRGTPSTDPSARYFGVKAISLIE